MAGHSPLQIVADGVHTSSFFILIWAIHANRSAEGVSLLTQAFYFIVFCTRYVDIFWRAPGEDPYLFIFKLLYLAATAYIMFIMMRVFPRTREREKAWKLASFCLGGSVIAAPIIIAAFHKRHFKALFSHNLPWTFSIVLESVCVLPQLLLLRQTTVPTVLSSYYLLTLGSYRAIYVVHWIKANAGHDSTRWDMVPLFFGIVQAAFYIDFAWVYYSRQRVKLRAGGVVDDDDLRKSWLLRRVLGDRAEPADEERDVDGEGHSGGGSAAAGGRWGVRGISVSADEDLEDRKASLAKGERTNKGKNDPNASAGELEGILENDESDDDGILPEVSSSNVTAGADEWRDAVPRK